MRQRVFAFFLSALFATGLWAAVNLSGMVQITVRVPLWVEIPEGKAATAPVPRQISVVLRGPGWNVAQFILLAKPHCRIDVNDLGTTGPTIMITKREILQAIAHPEQISISELEMDSLRITLEPRRSRTVAVVPDLRVHCRHGFEQEGSARVEPDSVMISGAESVVARISSWSTRPITVSDAVAPVRREIGLADSLDDLITIPKQSFTVVADVQENAERTFVNVPIHVTNPGVHIAPATTTVVIRGGAETLASMQSSDISASVDYLSLLEGDLPSATVNVSSPAHTTVLHAEPRTVSWFNRAHQ